MANLPRAPLHLRLVYLLLGVWLANTASAVAVQVKTGASIQAAVDSAKSGDWIFVQAGTYSEQLTLNSSGIHLVGLGNTILTPPATPKNNTCSGLAGNGTQAGICITGQNVKLAPYKQEHRKVLSVGTPVSNVLVTGFEIRGFSGANLAVYGGNNTLILGNEFVNGPMYGGVSAGSRSTHWDSNVVSSPQGLSFIGLCMDDLAGSQFSNNLVSGYGTGLCVQTPSADVRHNNVTNSCAGVFVDPGVHGAEVYGNFIGYGNESCLFSPFGGGVAGVVIQGSIDTDVRGNIMQNLTLGKYANATNSAVGVAILDDPTTDPPSLAFNNTIARNVMRNNDVDIFIMTNGTGNVAQNNTCMSSFPTGLCM